LVTAGAAERASVTARVNVLGVGITPTTMLQTVATVVKWIEQGEQQYVCVTSVNGVVEAQKDPVLRAIHNGSGLTVPDGMPMVWLCQRAGYTTTERVYGPDLMLALCERSASRQFRHFLYGGITGVADQLQRELEQRFPSITIVGTYSPPFRPLTEEEDKQVIEMINATRPDIVWVGLSTPKQERWMAAHVGRLNASVMLGVGAAFDFHTGRVKQAPPWMQRNGLEWLFRLGQEPQRLWRRYLVGNPVFLGHLVRQALRWHDYGDVS
jgi:N-acetylglucosaminyldiphosphoundecaprenol N-acetyl-beta-D-mannosaminyltransferase